jgi:hypothetical protein
MKSLLIFIAGIVLGGLLRAQSPLVDRLEQIIEEKAAASNVIGALAEREPAAFESACRAHEWAARTSAGIEAQ